MPDCYICDTPCDDTVVHLGIRPMSATDLESEMARGTEFGLKLREIAKKVEALA